MRISDWSSDVCSSDLVDQLAAEGVDRIFGVPGESYLAVLDALYDTPEITYHLCRQEGGAAMMADAYGKLTGRPGICFVTRGPGATRSEAPTSELQSLMRISYAVFCLKTKNNEFINIHTLP